MSILNKLSTIAKTAGKVVTDHPKIAAAVVVAAACTAVYVKVKRKSKAESTAKPEAPVEKAEQAQEPSVAEKAKEAVKQTAKDVVDAVKATVDAVKKPVTDAKTTEFNGPVRPADGVPMDDPARMAAELLARKAKAHEKEVQVSKDPNVVTVNDTVDITKEAAHRERKGEDIGEVIELTPITDHAPAFVHNPEPKKDISDVEVNIPLTPEEINERAAAAMKTAQEALRAIAESDENPEQELPNECNNDNTVDPEDASEEAFGNRKAMVGIVSAFKKNCAGAEVQGMSDDNVVAMAFESVREAAENTASLDRDTVTLDLDEKNGAAILKIGKATSTKYMHSMSYATSYSRTRTFTAVGAFRATLLLAQASESIRLDLGRGAHHAATVLECIERAYQEDNKVVVTFNERVTSTRNLKTDEGKVIGHQVDVYIQYQVRGEERFIHAVIH